MKNNTISVIIPVYNVEKYLPECMESVLGQSYTDLEIWLIDDGSTDHSGELCDEYAAKDPRVHVIHQQNGGAAAAKNAGLRAATGYYLTFLDSDDYLETDAYGYMISLLERHNVDVVQCVLRDVYVDHEEDCIINPDECVFTKLEYLKRYTVDWTCGLMTDKLFKRKLYDGIYFEEGHIIDDEFFTYQGIMRAKTILYSPRVVYNYRKRASSVTLRPEHHRRMIHDRLDYLIQRRARIGAAFPELKTVFEKHYLNMLQWSAHDALISEELLKRIQHLISEYFAETDRSRLDWRTWYRLMKIKYAKFSRWQKMLPPVKEENNLENCFA